MHRLRWLPTGLVLVLLLGAGPRAALAEAAGPPYEDKRISTRKDLNPLGTATADTSVTADPQSGLIEVSASASDSLPVGLCCFAGVFPSSQVSAYGSIKHGLEIATAGTYQLRVTLDVPQIDVTATSSEPYFWPARRAEGIVLVGLQTDFAPCDQFTFCYDSFQAEIAACGGDTLECRKPPPSGPVTLTLEPLMRLRNFGTLRVEVGLQALSMVTGPSSATAYARATVRSIEAVLI